MAEIEFPDELEVIDLYDRIVTILMALITLWAAVIGVFESRAGINGDMAAQLAQTYAVSAFGELIRADQRVSHSLDVYSSWYEAGEQIVQFQSAADSARLSGDESSAQVLEASIKRWDASREQLAELTPLLSAGYNRDYVRYFEESHRDSYLEYERQQAALRESDGWGEKGDAYVTVFTILAAVLFLLGISLTVENWLRYVFLGCGLLMLLISGIWVMGVYLKPVHITPEEAMEQFVEGLILSNIAFAAPEDAAERINDQALEAFNAALELDPLYADAYQWHGFTMLEKRLKGADPETNAQAAASMEYAIELGNDNSVVYTNLGWAYTLSGEYEKAITALEYALELEPTECLAYLNLGVARLGAEQTDQASATYVAAVDCMLDENPDERANLFASGELDLVDLAYVEADNPDVAQALLSFKETAVSLALLGEAQPEETTAKVTEIAFAGAIAADGGFLDVGDSFAPGAPAVYTIMRFEEMPPNAPWMVRWYHQDEIYDQYSSTWPDTAGGGQSWVRITGAPMPAGEYQAEIYVSGKLIASENFDVQEGEIAEMTSFTSSYFRLSINHPQEWVVFEDPTMGGYLYASPPDDDQNYFWYNTVPWSGGGGESAIGALLSMWYTLHPDLQYGQQGEFFLGGLAQASFLPTTYASPTGESLSALLVAMVDDAGNAHILVVQSPSEQFDQAYAMVFDPMLRSLEIAQ